MSERAELPKLYSLAEVCQATGYSYVTIWRLLRKHRIERYGNGRGTRISYAGYVQLLEAIKCRSGSTDPANEKEIDTASSGVGLAGDSLRSLRRRQTKLLRQNIGLSSSTSSTRKVVPLPER